MKITLFKDQSPERIEKDISEDIISGAPRQFAQLMYAGHEDTIKSGVWESSAGVFKANYDGIFEFCHVLEGGAVIETGAGESFTVAAGDSFILDEGLDTVWTVETNIRKHFVICKTP